MDSKLSRTEQAAYAIGMMLCIISDMGVDAWRWLECPAPDRPRPMEETPSFSNGLVVTLAIAAIVLTLFSLTGLWIFQIK